MLGSILGGAGGGGGNNPLGSILGSVLGGGGGQSNPIGEILGGLLGGKKYRRLSRKPGSPPRVHRMAR